jgi:hypothetical protein
MGFQPRRDTVAFLHPATSRHPHPPKLQKITHTPPGMPGRRAGGMRWRRRGEEETSARSGRRRRVRRFESRPAPPARSATFHRPRTRGGMRASESGRATTGATVGESGLRMRPLPSRGRSSSALVRGPRIGYISQTSRPSGIPSVSGSAGAAVLLAGGHCQCLSPSSSRSGGAAASGVALQGRTRPARRRLASGPRRRARSVMVHHALQRDQRSWPRLGDGHTAAALP